MKFIVKCPHCDNPFTVEENWAGQLTSCPVCGHQVRVPQPPPPLANDGQRPFTSVSQAVEPEERSGASFAGEAFVDFLFSLLCCCWFIPLIMTIRTHCRMHENNNYAGRIWIYLAYFILFLQCCGHFANYYVRHSQLYKMRQETLEQHILKQMQEPQEMP